MRTSTHIDLNGATKAHMSKASGSVVIQDYSDSMLFLGLTADTSTEGALTAIDSITAAFTKLRESVVAKAEDAAELAEVG